MTAKYINTKSAIFCTLLCLAYVATGFAAEVGSSHSKGVVRQVDHIVIRVETVADAESLWSLFSEKLKLPIAWPPADYGEFFSGGVNAGNVNIEFAYLNSRWQKSHWTPEFHTRAQFFGFGLEPEPLTIALQELERRGLQHDRPEPYQITKRDGGTQTLWTEVALPDLSRQMSVFLIEYDPFIWQTPDRPQQNIEQVRQSLKDELRQRDGGPAGILSVKEILIGTPVYKVTTRLWQTLLSPGAPEFHGNWQPAAGPAVRFVPARTEGIESIVIRVAALDRTHKFLKANGLLDQSTKRAIVMDHGTLLGIDIQFVE